MWLDHGGWNKKASHALDTVHPAVFLVAAMTSGGGRFGVPSLRLTRHMRWIDLAQPSSQEVSSIFKTLLLHAWGEGSAPAVLDLLVGRETAIFQRRANDTGKEHLSLSLVLRAALPAPPSADMSESDSGASGRESLDVSFDDEETFGLWVAAMRHLLSRLQQRAMHLLRGSRHRITVATRPGAQPGAAKRTLRDAIATQQQHQHQFPPVQHHGRARQRLQQHG